MSELIDRRATKELFRKQCDVVVGIREQICKDSGCWIIKQINEIPAIDAVPVVRCGECKWYEKDLMANPWGVCFHEEWVHHNCGMTVDEDGFCYRGERREQE